MTIDVFFETLEQQYKQQLPFVVYSRSVDALIKCWLQNDDTLHTTTNFSESGFVFSPFNLGNSSVLLPKAHCQYNELEVASEIKVETSNVIHHNTNNTSAKDTHLNLVKQGITEIKTTSLEKVVLSRAEEKQLKELHPITIFKRLFNTYKKAMVYCWYHPKVGLWIGATPELLFKVEGKRITMISLAGTQAYTKDGHLAWTEKEYEEQQIVTDYIVKQIEPFTKSINVSEVETVRAGNLLHLKSYIVGLIKDEADLKLIIEALHPTPAVCGFPKATSKQFILQHENYKREYYTGFLGELNLKQTKTRNTNRRNVENNAYTMVKTSSNFYVNLRCAQIKDNKALIYVGGGITKDSIPKNEWEETVNKTKTIVNILS